MRIRLLFDMNLSPRFADEFSKLGYTSEHWSAVGNPAAKDTEIMEFAKINNYVVVTYDLDFSAILAATQGEKPSVVQLRTDQSLLSDTVNLLKQATTQFEQELYDGAIVTIDVDRQRVRILPL